MKIHCRTLRVLVIALLPLAASAQQKDLVSDDARWAWAAQSPDIANVLAYIRWHPHGKHVDEARQRLQAWDDKPLARMTSDTPACREVLQSRVQSMLKQPVAKERMALYDFSLPAGGALLAQPSITFVPRGQSLESTPIEDRLTLNLIADRRGQCVVMLRWRHGSGLPESCTCAPLDPAR